MNKPNIESKIQELHNGDKEQLEFIFFDVFKENKKGIIVEAPAGYGKTRAMISKIAYLIATNQLSTPKKILALTFSVNAAYKIRKDVAEQLPQLLSDTPIPPTDIKSKVLATNYHGFCRRVLSLYGYLIHESLKNIENLKAIDDGDAEKLTELNIGLSSDEAIEITKYNGAVKKINTNTINIKYLKNNRNNYLEAIKLHFLPNGYITFNAILLLTIELFIKQPELLKFYRKLFPIIIVDEFQDTNILSWELLELLIGEDNEVGNKVIFMGDSLQRIYGFIGAIPDLMGKTEEKYKLQRIEFKTNYRFKNNQQLLLLDKNIRENAKDIKNPNIEDYAEIDAYCFEDQQSEAEGIIKIYKEILEKDPQSKIAILVKQRGKNTDEILDMLKNNNVNFFYALYSDEDEEYIDFHKKCLDEFIKLSSSGKQSFKRLTENFRKKVKEIYKNNNSKIYESLLILLENFLDKVFKDFEFLSTAEEKEEFIKDVLENRSLKQYMGYIDSKIIISTVHGAKGLEWDYVILADMEKYSFPNCLCGSCKFQNNCPLDWNSESSQLDESFLKKFYEELSVFYVACTRAKKQVIFTFSEKRINNQNQEKSANMSCLLNLPGIELKIVNQKKRCKFL